MQKKLIALAVAGLASGAAFAQSNVTIYGVVDAGYVHTSGEKTGLANNTFNGIQSGVLSGSRIGFKGEEALGNGLKAVFTLEYGLTVDDNQGIGTDTLKARQQFVGLSHAKLGTVTLGRQYAPGFYASVVNDVFAASNVVAPLNLMSAAAGNSINAGSNARWNNSIAYTSPTIAGFTGRAIYGYGETGTTNGTAANAAGQSTGTDGRIGLGLNYANGPLSADAVWHQRRNVQTTSVSATATDDNVNEYMLGASYDLKVVKLKATFQKQNDGNGTSTTELDNKVWSVGAEAPVFGKGKVHASYSKLTYQNNAANNDDSRGWMVGYTHSLSKRTTLYTAYTNVDNDRTSGAVAGNVTVKARNEDHNIFTAGINHAF